MQYRTMKLRELEAALIDIGDGGLEGWYRKSKAWGMTRKQMAAELGMSVPALEKWITKWNKEQSSAAGK